MGASVAKPVLDYAPPPPAGWRSLARIARAIAAVLAFLVLGAGFGFGLASWLSPLHYDADALLYISPASTGTAPLAARGSVLVNLAAQYEGSANLATARQTRTGSTVARGDWDDARVSAWVDPRTDLIHVRAGHANADKAAAMARALVESAESGPMPVGTELNVLKIPSAASLSAQRDRRLLILGAFLGAVSGIILKLTTRHRRDGPKF